MIESDIFTKMSRKSLATLTLNMQKNCELAVRLKRSANLCMLADPRVIAKLTVIEIQQELLQAKLFVEGDPEVTFPTRVIDAARLELKRSGQGNLIPQPGFNSELATAAVAA